MSVPILLGPDLSEVDLIPGHLRDALGLVAFTVR